MRVMEERPLASAMDTLGVRWEMADHLSSCPVVWSPPFEPAELTGISDFPGVGLVPAGCCSVSGMRVCLSLMGIRV